MPWDPKLYLKFSSLRARAAADLAAQIALDSPRRIVDLGCGTGNSTEQLRHRWPEAALAGVDSSNEMLAKARANYPDWEWIEATIENWAPASALDLVFSNACLHWVADHGRLFPRLFSYVAPGGALAVQMPNSDRLPTHSVMKEVSQAPGEPWTEILDTARHEFHVQTPTLYYQTLGKLAARVDIWETEYLQIMDGPEAILDWVRSTAIRRYTERMPTEEMRKRFEQQCLEGYRRAYPPDQDGKSLLPYRRLFLVAYRQPA